MPAAGWPTLAMAPGFMPDGAVYPVFWRYAFMPHDVDALDVEPEVKEALHQAWREVAFLELVKGTQDTVYHDDINFGSGCSLVRRRVLEWCGYYLGAGYHSEDLHFGQYATAYGFTKALDTAIHCPHFDPNGRIY